jgi:hypothetical protein
MRKDPGNPRYRGEERPGSEKSTAVDESVGIVDAIAMVTRGLCLVGVFALLVVSACLAVSVFYVIGSLIRDPATAKNAVNAIAELISADKLAVAFAGDERLEFGNLVAFLLYLFCFLLWLYVPASLITVSSRILLGSLAQKKTQPQKQSDQ